MKTFLVPAAALALLAGAAYAQTTTTPPAPDATMQGTDAARPQPGAPDGGPAGPGAMQPGADVDAPPPPPPGGPGAPPPPPPGGHGMGGHGMGRHGMGGPGFGGPGAPPPPFPGGPGFGPEGPGRYPMPSKAPHVRIDRPDLHLDVKCADDDSTRTCTDAAAALIDKIRTLPAPVAPAVAPAEASAPAKAP